MSPSLKIQAPAGFHSDLAGRRTSRFTLSARGSYPSCPLQHRGSRDASEHPILFSPEAGSSHMGAFLHARRGRSCQIIRREPHLNISASNRSTSVRYRKGIVGCHIIHVSAK